VTAFKDGFQKGPVRDAAPLDKGGKVIPSAQLARNAPNASRAFDLRTEPARMDDRTGTSTIEVINLDRALLYSFRLVDISVARPAIATVTVEAPVCVADMKEGR
jgi:hypothetical protein